MIGLWFGRTKIKGSVRSGARPTCASRGGHLGPLQFPDGKTPPWVILFRHVFTDVTGYGVIHKLVHCNGAVRTAHKALVVVLHN